MKKHFWKISIVTVLVAVAITTAFIAGIKCGADDEPKEEVPPISAVEVINELIALEEKKASAEAATPPVHTPASVNPPALSDKPIYIDGSINFEQANFLKEITVFGIYGEKWSMWMQSTLLFRKTAYKAQEISDNIQLLVFLRPTSERNDNNYITLSFDIYPPQGDKKRWSAIVNFDSRTQGRAWFPLAYDVFIQDWQEEEITNLARQVLNIALIESAD